MGQTMRKRLHNQPVESLESRVLLSTAYAVNDASTVPADGFFYHRGQLHTLGLLPGGDHCGALAINNHGLIVGEADDQDGIEHAVVFKNGVPHVVPGGGTSAFAVDDAGDILVYANDQMPSLLVSPNGRVTDLTHAA